MTESIQDKAQRIADALPKATKVLMVGGCVRDEMLGLPLKDIDLEVFGMDYDAIASALRRAGFRISLVGRAFAVIKVDNEIDVSIPRRETKQGSGHRGFAIQPSPDMDFAEAALRRDFTINAMARDFNGELFDPHGGAADLQAGILRAVSPAFAEDPLRVLRAMQFAGRFNLQLDPQTAAWCHDLRSEFPTIATERIWIEWEKWAALSVRPSRGIEVLTTTGWMEFFPEIAAMRDLPQDPEWHPEGCVLSHTCHVLDAAAAIAEREHLDRDARRLLLFAALCHDFGKATTTVRNDEGRWSAPRHAIEGTGLTTTFLQRIHAPLQLVEVTVPLVAEHMTHISHEDEEPSDRSVRRLANRLHPASLRMLALVCEADHSGRPPLPGGRPLEPWLAVADRIALADQRPKPILQGRDLLRLGHVPGPAMGDLLRAAFEVQLDGGFADLEGAIRWIKETSRNGD